MTKTNLCECPLSACCTACALRTPADTARRSLARVLLVMVLAGPALIVSGCTPVDDATTSSTPKQATAPTLQAPSAAPPGAPTASPNPIAQTPMEQAKAKADALAQSQQDQHLIDQAERAYQSGVSNYQAGRLDAARADFDKAVDLFLTSGRDIRADAQLNDEFEHVLDAVNTLEMTALKQGNGFAPKVEPSPVDVANDVTFTVDPAIRAAAEAELKTTQSDLPLVMNDYVAGFINYFSKSTRGHNTIVNSLQRAGRYQTMIRKVLRDEGVPEDLIYLAVAESGFQLQALNARSGAGGMWQFMPTGAYGLARNGWYDERFDPEKSTRAYARYIKGLYAQFGDWYLAMAAYDWGPGYVQRAVQRTGYADFWELYRRNALPQETKNYVPIILAATIMAKNPSQYGLAGMTPEPEIRTDTVTTTGSVDLRLVADVVGATTQQIVAINPSLLRLTTPRDMSFDLHLPAGTKDLYQQRIAMIPEDKRASWRYHTVVEGDTIAGIAQSFHVSPQQLASVNQLEVTDTLAAHDALVVPVAVQAPAAGHTAHYRVRKGDTVVTIADRFNITPQNLREWNHLTGTTLTSGRTLVVSEPVHLAPSRRGSSSRKAGKRGASSRTASRSTTPPGKKRAVAKSPTNTGSSRTRKRR